MTTTRTGELHMLQGFESWLTSEVVSIGTATIWTTYCSSDFAIDIATTMVRSLNAANFSIGRGVLQVMFLTAILLSSRCSVVVASITDTANQSSFHWLHSMPAVRVTSEDYLLASTMPSWYGSNWPAAAQNVGRNAEEQKEDGSCTHSGDLIGEIEREAIWAKGDDTERVLEMQFEKEFAQMFSISGGAGIDDLARVGYMSNSKPLYRFSKGTESSIDRIEVVKLYIEEEKHR